MKKFAGFLITAGGATHIGGTDSLPSAGVLLVSDNPFEVTWTDWYGKPQNASSALTLLNGHKYGWFAAHRGEQAGGIDFNVVPQGAGAFTLRCDFLATCAPSGWPPISPCTQVDWRADLDGRVIIRLPDRSDRNRLIAFIASLDLRSVLVGALLIVGFVVAIALIRTAP